MTDLCANSHGDVVPREKWPRLRGGAKACVFATCVCLGWPVGAHGGPERAKTCIIPRVMCLCSPSE